MKEFILILGLLISLALVFNAIRTRNILPMKSAFCLNAYTSYAYKNILVKNQNEAFIKEKIAAGTITPGMLMETDSAGKFAFHSASGGDASKLFALEAEWFGAGVDTDYSANDQVRGIYAQSGDEIWALLANGQSVTKGDLLESDGAGALTAYTAQAVDENSTGTYTIYLTAVVCRAMETINNSSGGVVRILVEVA